MRLIVVANRLSLSIKKEGKKFIYKQSSGGLATGLKCVKKEINFTWVGNVTGIKEEDQPEVTETCLRDFQSVPVFISTKLNEVSYNGFCNKVLWPMLHSFDNFSFDENTFLSYKKYNSLFCEKVCEIVEEGDVVWVHDYHLMLLPKMIKERMPGVKVAFFLHTPFPSDDVFFSVPYGKDVLKGILGAEVVGFHLPAYRVQFLDSCKKILSLKDFRDENEIEGGKTEEIKEEIKNQENASKNEEKNSEEIKEVKAEEINSGKNEEIKEEIKEEVKTEINKKQVSVKGIKYTPSSIQAGNKKVTISAIPIGIDPSIFRETLKKEKVKKRIKEIKEKFKGKKIILGVDRTDYIKGLPQRVKAFGLFKEKYKEAVYLQIAVPSRMDVLEYYSLVEIIKKNSFCSEEKVDEKSTFLFNKSVDFEELCALYASADVMLITSLRDGMNLVALEYIACQDEKMGSLILSEYAGAVDTLPGCLTVNPWSQSDLVEKMTEAVCMNGEERRRRFLVNKEGCDKFSAVYWARKNVDALMKE